MLYTTSVDPDQPAQSRSLIGVYAVRQQIVYGPYSS